MAGYSYFNYDQMTIGCRKQNERRDIWQFGTEGRMVLDSGGDHKSFSINGSCPTLALKFYSAIRTGEVIENGKRLRRSPPQRREMAGKVTIFVDLVAEFL